jgi:hypothetical protein
MTMSNNGKVYWTGELTGAQVSGYPFKPSNGKYFTQAERDSFGSSGSGKDRNDSSGGIGLGTGGGTTNPQPFSWSFPQYSQTWAFTPPTPTPYMNPPRFDPKSSSGYAGMASSTKNGKDSKTPSMSLMDLWKRYGLT